MMKKIVRPILRHLVIALLSFVWLIPIGWLLATSFSTYPGINISHFFPESYTFDNYLQLFGMADTVAQFPRWFANTFVIAVFTCLISTCFVLMVAYATSCMRFKARKPLMNIGIILGMFPGVLSMIAVYFVLKSIGLTNSHFGMIIVYSASSGLGQSGTLLAEAAGTVEWLEGARFSYGTEEADVHAWISGLTESIAQAIEQAQTVTKD